MDLLEDIDEMAVAEIASRLLLSPLVVFFLDSFGIFDGRKRRMIVNGQ